MLKECGLLFVCWATVVFAGILQPLPSHSAMGDCRSNEDCGPDRCCLLGMMRYSTPWCAPLLNFGEDCRPTSSNEPSIINRTLAYPGGLEIFLKDAYQILCPCDANQGLECSHRSGTCMSSDVLNDISPLLI